jgi:hypothetical protein
METKVHYCVHKSPPLIPILSQINPVHTIQLNINIDFLAHLRGKTNAVNIAKKDG